MKSWFQIHESVIIHIVYFCLSLVHQNAVVLRWETQRIAWFNIFSWTLIASNELHSLICSHTSVSPLSRDSLILIALPLVWCHCLTMGYGWKKCFLGNTISRQSKCLTLWGTPQEIVTPVCMYSWILFFSTSLLVSQQQWKIEWKNLQILIGIFQDRIQATQFYRNLQ